MSDTSGTSDAAAGAPAAATDSGPAVEPVADATSGGNPAWDSLRSALGETGFKLAEPHLREWDKSASTRVTKANEELKRYADLGGFEDLQTARQIQAAIDADPLKFLTDYQNLLREQGQLNDENADADDVDDEDGDEEDDPRIVELQRQIDALTQGSQAQQLERDTQQYLSEIDTEAAALKAANPWMTDTMVRKIIGDSAKFVNDRSTTKDVIAKSAAEFIELRNEMLSTPRAGASAPKLVSAGGGNPAAQPPADIKNASRSDTQKLVASMIESARNAG